MDKTKCHPKKKRIISPIVDSVKRIDKIANKLSNHVNEVLINSKVKNIPKTLTLEV